MSEQDDTIRVSRAALKQELQDAWEAGSNTCIGRERLAVGYDPAYAIDALIAATPQEQPRRFTDEERIADALLTIVRNPDREVTRRILDATDQWTRGSRVDMHAVKNYALDAILTLAKERAMLAESAPEVKE